MESQPQNPEFRINLENLQVLHLIVQYECCLELSILIVLLHSSSTLSQDFSSALKSACVLGSSILQAIWPDLSQTVCKLIQCNYQLTTLTGKGLVLQYQPACEIWVFNPLLTLYSIITPFDAFEQSCI